MEQTADKITLVVHTPALAARVCAALEAHGINVSRVPVAIPGDADGAEALCVAQTDLAAALRVTESGLRVSAYKEEMKLAGMSGHLLIPVDFTPLTEGEIKVGFDLARRLGLSVVILHAYPAGMFASTMPSDPFPGSFTPDNTLEDIQINEEFDQSAEQSMARLKADIEARQKSGVLPDVTFTTTLLPGVAEDVIRAYVRQTPPELIVMATRGASRRSRDLIGSVTAEVLDSCRVPVFTVPEKCHFEQVESIKKLAFFCNLDSQDVMSVDFLMRMFGYPDVEIVLVPVVEKGDGKQRLESFRSYLAGNYPEAEFSVCSLDSSDFRGSFENLLHTSGVELLIVPNRKKNIFSRLFNPGIPHKILFERDVPMLALPV